MPFGGAVLGKRLFAGPELGGIISGGAFDPSAISGYWFDWDASGSCYKESTPVTPVTNGDVCGLVVDAAGNFDLIQAAGTKKPLWYSSDINSSPSITFDGFDDFQDSLPTAKPGNWTVFMLAKVASITSRQFPFGSVDSSASVGRAWNFSDLSNAGDGNGYLRLYHGDNTKYGQTITTVAVYAAATVCVLATRYTSGDTDIDIWKDASAVATTNPVTDASTCAGTAYKYSVGRGGEYDGLYSGVTFRRIIGYNAALLDADVVAVSNFLSTY